MQGWTNDASFVGRVFLVACTVATAVIGTFLMASRQKKTNDTDVKTSVEACKRRLTVVQRKQLMEVAGSYSLVNLQFLSQLFGTTNDLQKDTEGTIAHRLVHGKPVHKTTVGVATEVVECRNVCTLEMHVKGKRNDLLPFVKSLDPLRGSTDNAFHAFMLQDRPGTPAVVVRITGKRPTHHGYNPVTLSFFVQSYWAAQKVQGYLLLMGEFRNLTARCQGDTLDTADVDAFRRWQEIFRDRDAKADVEIHLDNLNTWNDIPQACVDTPLTMPGAWETLANVFQQLEILPQYQEGPIIMGQFNPSGPTVFGTLRIHYGIHDKMEQHGMIAEKFQNKESNKTRRNGAIPINIRAYSNGSINRQIHESPAVTARQEYQVGTSKKEGNVPPLHLLDPPRPPFEL